jgi:hypothetical protein
MPEEERDAKGGGGSLDASTLVQATRFGRGPFISTIVFEDKNVPVVYLLHLKSYHVSF